MHKLSAFAPSILDAPICLEQPWVKTYPIAAGLNNLLCTLNTFFVSAASSPGGETFLDYFGGVFVAAVLVTTYEGFRPSSRRSASKDAHGNVEGFGMRLGVAQLSTLALAIGQVITAGVALPIYYALVSWSTPKHWRRHHHKIDLGDDVFFMPEKVRKAVQDTYKHSVQYNANVPRSSFLYTTLISAISGFLVPSAIMGAVSVAWQYDAQTAWQIFPLYMLVINIVFPPLLRRSFSNTSPLKGIVLIAALGIIVSLKSQYRLITDLRDEVTSLTDVLTIGSISNLASTAHRVLVVGFALVTVTVGSKVLLALARRTRAGTGGKFVYALVLLAGAAVVGPGAAIMSMWAYSELVALRHAREYAEAKQAKAVVVETIRTEVVEVQ